MWVLVMFDLPVGTKREMKLTTQFRNSLLELGFVRKQFSVYMRHCENMDKAQRLAESVGRCLVENGQVTVLFLTDRQFGMSRNFFGKVQTRNEQEAMDERGQLYLF